MTSSTSTRARPHGEFDAARRAFDVALQELLETGAFVLDSRPDVHGLQRRQRAAARGAAGPRGARSLICPPAGAPVLDLVGVTDCSDLARSAAKLLRMPVALRVPIRTALARAAASDVSGEAFTRDGDDWVLELELPDVLRLEYKLEVDHPDGGNEWILDPGNPKRTPGAFGEKSVLELPGYAPPAWLEAETVAGPLRRARGPRPRARRDWSAMRVWSPADAAPGTPLRLLLANDGPEYDALSSLTRFSAAKIARGRAAAAPGRAARARRPQPVVLAPRPRTRACSRTTSCPRCATRFGVIGAPAAMGASLGGAGDAARAAPLPARVRRAVPAVRVVLHARATTRRSAASAATRGSSASCARRCATGSTRCPSR